MVAVIPNSTTAEKTVAETTSATGATPSERVSERGGVRISEEAVTVSSERTSATTPSSTSTPSIVQRVESLREFVSSARQTASVLTLPTLGSDAAFSADARVGGRPSAKLPRRAVYRAKTLRDKDRRTQHWSESRKRCAGILESALFELTIGITILVNIGVLIMQANASVGCEEEESSCGSLLGYVVINALLLTFYSGELLLRMYTYRAQFFTTFWNNLDLVIVLTGFVDLVIDILHTSDVSHSLIGLLRFFRATRIFRAFRLLAFIPELYRLIQLLSGALRALFWGLVLIIFMVIFWSVITIEFVKPVLSEVDFGEEDICTENFKSIWHTIIYFFQTLVVVDDWATCIKPLIIEKPWTILFFGLAVISVQLFFLNLILSAIVDAAAASREQDHEHRALENERLALARMDKWKTIYASMDAHMEGYVSKEELQQSFEEEEQVREFLQGLDVSKQDLGDIFDLMDEDGSGLLPYNEYVSAFVKAQTQDARIYMMTVKLQTNHLLRAMREQAKQIQDIRTTVMCSAEQFAKQTCCFHQKEGHEDIESSDAFSLFSAPSIVSVPPHVELVTPKVATPRVATQRVAKQRVATPRSHMDSESQLQQTHGEQRPVSPCSGNMLALGTDRATLRSHWRNHVENETREQEMSRELHHDSRMPCSSDCSHVEAARSEAPAAELTRCLSAQLAEMQQQLIAEMHASVRSALLHVLGTRSGGYQLESAEHLLSAADEASASHRSDKDPRLSDDEIHGASTCRSTADSCAKRDESARREKVLASLKVVRFCYV